MKTDRQINRAVTKQGDWDGGVGKKCPGCLQAIERDDLIMVEKVTTDNRKRKVGYDAMTGAKPAVYVPVIRWRYWHKKHWYEARGEEDWYHPGILAEDPEDNPRRMDMDNPKSDANRWFYKFPGQAYAYGPTINTYTSKEAAKEGIKKAWGLDAWPRGAEVWRASKHEYPNPVTTQIMKRPAGPTSLQTWTGPRQKSRKGGGAMMMLLLATGIGLAGYAAYVFLIQHKYNVGDVLQYLTEVGTTWQVAEIKFVGITRVYVLNSSAGGSQQISVRKVDGDSNWVGI